MPRKHGAGRPRVAVRPHYEGLPREGWTRQDERGESPEGATPEEDRAILRALEQTEKVERLIHIRTHYLGPDEMLVAAKIALAPEVTLATVAATIDAAEVNIRAAVPAARVIYLEPDLDRAALTR